MNEPIRSELWALEALEKTGKESLEMSQNQPGDPGEGNETVKVVWDRTESKVFEFDGEKYWSNFNAAAESIRVDYTDAELRGSGWSIRPLPATPVEFISEATAEALRKIAAMMYDDGTRAGCGSIGYDFDPLELEAVLNRLRSPLAAGGEGGGE